MQSDRIAKPEEREKNNSQSGCISKIQFFFLKVQFSKKIKKNAKG